MNECTNDEENDDFLLFLQQHDSKAIDTLVHTLNDNVSKTIDCTSCGNCCRSLMINIEPGEPEQLAIHLNMPLRDVKEQFIEESQQGKMIINTIPCHFLNDNKCSIYTHRFKECREFPHLHKPGFHHNCHLSHCIVSLVLLRYLKLYLMQYLEEDSPNYHLLRVTILIHLHSV